MKTRILTLASALLLGAVAGAGGCVDNRASIAIQMICQPSDDCTFTDGCKAEAVGYPTYDTAASTAGGIRLILQVENRLQNNEDLTVGHLNTNDAHVDELDVTITGAANGEYTIGANGLIPAASQSTVAVPIALGTPADGEVLARVRVRGYYDDGSRFETGEFPITVVVCSGCLTSLCGGAPTCPASSEGQRPLECLKASTTTP